VASNAYMQATTATADGRHDMGMQVGNDGLFGASYADFQSRFYLHYTRMSIWRLKGPRDLAAALSALMPPAAPKLASLYLQSPDFDATCGPWPPLAGLTRLDVASEALPSPGSPLIRSLAPQLRSLTDLELSLKGAHACQALAAAAEVWAAQPQQAHNEPAGVASQPGREDVRRARLAVAEPAVALEPPSQTPAAAATVPGNPHSASTQTEPGKASADAAACRLIRAVFGLSSLQHSTS
jgi:hypothetical protein